MASSYLSLTELTPIIEKRALVLVPNKRLRNHLLRAYALQQTAKAWLKPNIQSLSQWLENQWEQLQVNLYPPACKTIASPLQRQMLWEKAIAQSPLGANLLQPQPLALQADSALQHLELWALTENDIHSDNTYLDHNSNAAQFSSWLKNVKADLKRQGTITKESSFGLIAQAYRENILVQLSEIYLEGFDDLSPLMQQVLTAATRHLIRLPNQSATNTQLIRTQATNTDDEIRSAALWAKAVVNSAPDTALIGIVAPNLGQSRDNIERIFTEVFEPTAILPGTPRYTLPFNFSAGTPLGNTPLIYSLFEILNLKNNDWEPTRLCNLLCSPFWGDAEHEFAARSQLTNHLRELGKLTVSTSDLRYCIQKIEAANPAMAILNLSKRFDDLGNLLRRDSGNRPAREWLQLFDELLTHIGWPGARRLDSQEYQQLKQWFEVRDQFIAIDSHCAPLSYTQACRVLRQLADKTPFQPQTPDSPIQILGALEAAGLQFSHLWVMGLSDNQWPPVPAPNSLLPLALQRTHKMPHASAERELEIAQGLTRRYRQSAPLVIFSNAHSDGDNELRTSALIRDLPLTPITELIVDNEHTLQHHYQQLLAASKLDVIQDANGPTLREHEIVRGGATLFKLQASCPFTAFAELRLGAKNPDAPVIGFSAAERGNILHESLATIWKTLQNSTQLNTLNNDTLKQLVNEKTTAVINTIQQQNPRKFGRQYCALEQERLSNLLCEWLSEERNRPAFQIVAIEQEQTVEFASLSLTLRIDRIDEFENGDRLLIDYKTGSASSKSWFGDRLSEPQLPLYLVSSNEADSITAISFAVINRKQQCWDGVGNLQVSSATQTNIRPLDDWSLQLQTWQDALQKLANDFINGDARVDFIDKKTEQYSMQLLPLNRLPDATALELFSLQEHKS